MTSAFRCSEVSPVALPSQGQLFPDSGRATVSGWGTLRSGGALPDLLHAVEVPLVSDASCEDSYGNRMSAKEMLCAGEAGKDSCQGDSGGPLICKVRKNSCRALLLLDLEIASLHIAFNHFALDSFRTATCSAASFHGESGAPTPDTPASTRRCPTTSTGSRTTLNPHRFQCNSSQLLHSRKIGHFIWKMEKYILTACGPTLGSNVHFVIVTGTCQRTRMHS